MTRRPQAARNGLACASAGVGGIDMNCEWVSVMVPLTLPSLHSLPAWSKIESLFVAPVGSFGTVATRKENNEN